MLQLQISDFLTLLRSMRDRQLETDITTQVMYLTNQTHNWNECLDSHNYNVDETNPGKIREIAGPEIPHANRASTPQRKPNLAEQTPSMSEITQNQNLEIQFPN